MVTARNALMASVAFGSVLVAGCSSAGEARKPQDPPASSRTSPDAAELKAKTPSTSPASISSPSPSAPAGPSLVLAVTTSDGYQGTLTITMGPLKQYTYAEAPAAVQACRFFPIAGSGEFDTVAFSASLAAKTVGEFTWPADESLRVFVKDDSSVSQGALCNGADLPDGLHPSPASASAAWMQYEAEDTPNNPHGWTDPKPWSAIQVSVDNSGSKSYTCAVLTKDPAFTADPGLAGDSCAFLAKVEP